jgi:high-affinity iron transporter
MDFSAALPTFVITLREGVEAALVVGIVLAYLKQAQQTRLNRWVYAGIGIGIAASVLIGILFNGGLAWLRASDQPYAAVLEPLLESTFGIAAIALLSWMLVWMTQQAKGMKAEVQGAVDSALEQSNSAGWPILTLILIAVLREGFETVVFIAAQFQAGLAPVMGAIAGLIGAVIIGVLLFRLGIKINLKRFFQVMGVFLLLIVSGLVIGALHHIDETLLVLAQVKPQWASFCEAGADTCILGRQVWDLSATLPDKTFPGVFFKALLGYRDHLYAVQLIAYLIFLTSIGGLYWRSVSGALKPQASQPRAEASS